MKPWEAKVAYNEALTSRVYALGLKPEHDAIPRVFEESVLETLPGRFYMVRVAAGSDPLLRRPFSHARLVSAEGGECIELIYEVKGRGTAMLKGLEAGACIDLIGPLGAGFSVDKSAERLIMVAGGIGVVPVYGLLHCLLERRVGMSMEFIWGARTGKDFFRLEELRGAGGRGHEHIKVHLATEDGSQGFKGLATGLLNELLEKSHGSGMRIFACGPKGMLKETALLAKAHNLHCQVSMEEKMACGFGACLGCAVQAAGGGYLHVCKDGPVFDIKDIDWSLV